MKQTWQQSKKAGIILSYVMIALNALSSILLVPVYLDCLGVDGYGFYQMIYSVASYILILDFGIGTVMIRFISEYKTRKDERGAENFAAHCAMLIGCVCVAIIVIGLLLRGELASIYKSLTAEKVVLGQKMFLLMIAVLVMTVIERYYEGLIMANDSFSVAKLISIVKLGVKFGLVIVFLYGNLGVISLVYVDVIVEILALAMYIFYNQCHLKFKIKLHCFDKSLFKPMATFMAAIMLQSIVAYLNNTVDKTILGIMLGETASGIYGLSMTFITLFNMIPTVILTIFLPQATRMVVQGAPMDKHTQMATNLGRYQMVVCGGILSAFVVLGRDFISLWAGTTVNEIWLTALIIMIPNAVPLIQNYCLNVLDAMNKRMFRSATLLGLSVLNVGLTIMMIKWWGYIGAAIATAVAYVIGHGIVINIYYHKKIGINIIAMWKGILHRLFPCVLIVTVLTLPLMMWNNTGWVTFLCKCIIWGLVYVAMLFVMGLKQDEKQMCYSFVKKLCRRN